MGGSFVTLFDGAVLVPYTATDRLLARCVKVRTSGYKQDGTVVITFTRTVMLYKRAHVPERPRPVPKA